MPKPLKRINIGGYELPGPKSESWLKETYSTIGASSAAAAVGKSRFRTRSDLCRIMRDVVHRGVLPKAVETPDMRRGTALEPVALAVFAADAEPDARPADGDDAYLYSEDLPWAHARPDGYVIKGSSVEPMEIKVPRPQTFRRMLLTGVPDDYILQVAHQVAVAQACGLYPNEGHFVAMCPVTLEILHVRVAVDKELADSLMDGERTLWSWVEADKEAPPDDDPQADAPQIVIPDHSGPLKVLDGKIAAKAAESYLWSKALKEEAEDLVGVSKDRLLALLESADAGEVPGLLRVYHREQAGRRIFDHHACVRDHPELAKYYRTGKPFKSFRAYPLKEKETQL